MSMNTERTVNALGAMAEVSLTMYRAAIGTGATPEEAKNIIEAYFCATIKYGNTKIRDAEDRT